MPPELRRPVAARNLDPVEEEETVDLLGHRYFRASILCRPGVVRAPASRQQLIADAHIAASLRLRSESLDLTEGIVEHFVGAGGNDISVDSSVTKAAVVLLGANWPFGVRLDQLFRESLSLLEAHDCRVQLGARSQLLAEIAALFEAGQIDLRLREPLYSSEIAGTRRPTHWPDGKQGAAIS